MKYLFIYFNIKLIKIKLQKNILFYKYKLKIIQKK